MCKICNGLYLTNNQSLPRTRLVVLIAGISVLFGALTLFSGGATLFVNGAARAGAGHYGPFVLWFNFIAGFAYIIAGFGLYLWRRWAVNLSMFIFIATIFVFIMLGFYIAYGGAYEARTIGAMILRSVVWLMITLVARAAWKRGNA